MSTYVEPILLEFEPLEEPWCKYQLSDGSVLYVKVVLVRAGRLPIYDNIGQPLYQFLHSVLLSVKPEPNMRKPPTIPPPTEREIVETSEEVQIARTIDERSSRYRLEDGTTAEFRPVITSVKRSSKFDSFWVPIYYVTWQIVSKLDIPKALWKKETKP